MWASVQAASPPYVPVGTSAAPGYACLKLAIEASLRALMTALLHAPCSPDQMTYGLRRLRLAGLTRKIERTNTYVLTPDGIKFAVFYTKLHNRLLRPLMAADQAQAPLELRQALRVLNQHVDDYISHARLGKAA
jgi:hypothetical protein